MNNLKLVIKNVANQYRGSDIKTNLEVNKIISGEIRAERVILNNYRRGNRR